MDVKKLARQALPKQAIPLAEEAYRKGRLGAVNLRYGLPARKLKVIGVTGTNGKTTTCGFINEMLKHAGFTTAMLTTAVNEMAGKQTLNRIHRTVPLTADLFKFLKQAARKKVDYVILELTSQALHQHKVWGIPVEIAVMTNLTQDHLDYHKTMEGYAAAKARLFNHYMKPKHCVLNRDDEWFDYFQREAAGEVMTYGQAPTSTVRMSKLQTTGVGSSVALEWGNTSLQLKSQLIGEFNLYNAVAAACVGFITGMTPDKIARGVGALEAVPGRMESINAGQDFGVVVDYAHAPDALTNVLKTLKGTTKGRVIVVFGATGDRDKSKRPLMGEAAAKYADVIFLTDDETYSEAAAPIRKAVMDGIKAAHGAGKTTEIGDRLEAIKAAFKSAKKGDVVLLAGLGHQDYRAMKAGKVPWDERDVARKLLKSSK